MIKVLVTGATGQVATALRQAPGFADMEIVTCGRPTLDLVDPASIEKVLARVKPDLVVNAAAYTAVDAAEDDVDSAFALNRDGAANIAVATNAASLPVIHISTDYVYDGRKQAPYVESDPTNPQNVYGRTKLAGEQALAAANPRHLILRTAWVYSPTGSNFVKTMLHLARDRPQLPVVADQFGSPTYAPHIAAAVLEIARQINACSADDREALWGIYHLAGTGQASWHEFAKEIFDQSKMKGGPSCKANPITTSEYPTRAARPVNSRLDCTRLEKTFGAKLPPWQEGLEDCIKQLASELV